MEPPDSATRAAFEAALPDDPRVVRSQMFGFPCAFVQGNLFFGTFSRSLIARVGEARAAALIASQQAAPFVPMPGRPWAAYVCVPTGSPEADGLPALAWEALEATAALPPKVPKPRKPRA